MPTAVPTTLPPHAVASDLSAFLTRVAEQTQEETVRSLLHEEMTKDDRRFREYAGIVGGIVRDLIGLMKQGQAVEIDEFVASLRRYELEEQKRRVDIGRKAAPTVRLLARKRPKALPLLNETLDGFRMQIDRLAELYRDARWDLMRARAHYLPSPGAGRIHGDPTDIDDYLKTGG